MHQGAIDIGLGVITSVSIYSRNSMPYHWPHSTVRYNIDPKFSLAKELLNCLHANFAFFFLFPYP